MSLQSHPDKVNVAHPASALRKGILGNRVKKVVENKLMFLATITVNSIALLLVFPFAWRTFVPGCILIVTSVVLYLVRFRIGTRRAMVSSIMAAVVACAWCAVGPLVLLLDGYIVTANGNPTHARWRTIELPDREHTEMLLIKDPVRTWLSRVLRVSDTRRITTARIGESQALVLPMRGAISVTERSPGAGIAVRTDYYPAFMRGRFLSAWVTSERFEFSAGIKYGCHALLSEPHLVLSGVLEWNAVRFVGSIREEGARYSVLLNEAVEAIMRGDAAYGLAVLELASASAPSALERARVLCLQVRVARGLLGGNIGIFQSLIYLNGAHAIAQRVLPPQEEWGPIEAFIATTLYEGYGSFGSLFLARRDQYSADLEETVYFRPLDRRDQRPRRGLQKVKSLLAEQLGQLDDDDLREDIEYILDRLGKTSSRGTYFDKLRENWDSMSLQQLEPELEARAAATSVDAEYLRLYLTHRVNEEEFGTYTEFLRARSHEEFEAVLDQIRRDRALIDRVANRLVLEGRELSPFVFTPMIEIMLDISKEGDLDAITNKISELVGVSLTGFDRIRKSRVIDFGQRSNEHLWWTDEYSRWLAAFMFFGLVEAQQFAAGQGYAANSVLEWITANPVSLGRDSSGRPCLPAHIIAWLICSKAGVDPPEDLVLEIERLSGTRMEGIHAEMTEWRHDLHR